MIEGKCRRHLQIHPSARQTNGFPAWLPLSCTDPHAAAVPQFGNEPFTIRGE
jgi:hypothetical protein